MSYWKLRGGLEKSDAKFDYGQVKLMCLKHGCVVVDPEKDTVKEIDRATSVMLCYVELVGVVIPLMRGREYYECIAVK